MDLQKDASINCKATNGEYRICRSVLELDRLINLPVLKGHCQTGVTCALKNLKGCIPDSEKRRYHREGLHQPIADLNEILRADLILVDGLEGGNPSQMNLFLAAIDPVLIDSYVTIFLGLTPFDVPYIGKAGELGVGSIYSKESILTYLNKEKGACSACYAALIHALVELEREDIIEFLKNA